MGSVAIQPKLGTFSPIIQQTTRSNDEWIWRSRIASGQVRNFPHHFPQVLPIVNCSFYARITPSGVSRECGVALTTIPHCRIVRLMADQPILYSFVETLVFSKRLDELASIDTLAAIQTELLGDPKRWPVIPGTHGARKGRIPDPQRGKGKRGSFRYLYLFFGTPRTDISTILFW